MSATVGRPGRGWLIAALGAAVAVLLGSVLAVGAGGSFGERAGDSRTGSHSSVMPDRRGDHGPMMGRDSRSGRSGHQPGGWPMDRGENS